MTNNFLLILSVNKVKCPICIISKLLMNSQIKEMMDFGNTLVKWKYEIVNSFVPANGRRISNGLIENRNKSIKLLKHSSNGYLNWHRFKTRIMYSLNKDSTSVSYTHLDVYKRQLHALHVIPTTSYFCFIRYLQMCIRDRNQMVHN